MTSATLDALTVPELGERIRVLSSCLESIESQYAADRKGAGDSVDALEEEIAFYKLELKLRKE